MLSLFKKIFLLGIITITLPLLAWGLGFMAFSYSIYSMTEPKTSIKIDGAIVLTGGSNRVAKGIDLLANQKIDNLLVSGVHKDVQIKDIMALWGQSKSAPPCCITLGREAGNTIGNALEAKKWIESLKLKTVYVITANYHMPRSLLEFRHHIPDTKIISFPIKPEKFDIRLPIFWRTAFIEYNKFIATLVRIVIYPRETEAIPASLKK